MLAQRDLLIKQSEQIKEMTFQLGEMRRMQKQEVQQEAKKVSSTEKRAAALYRKMGDLSHEHEMAMAAAAASMKELQSERDALCMALAAIATQAVREHPAAAKTQTGRHSHHVCFRRHQENGVKRVQVGGEEADAQAMSREISASVREGNDPIPHTAQTWLHFKYTDVSEASKGMRSKKLSGDGVRAVAALVAQVRRPQ